MDAFEQAIRAWSNVGLPGVQKELDDAGTKIVEYQTTSAQGRKELANKTKQFRKLNDQDKLNEVKGLLKLYQQEIDNLTDRGKFAETSFMNVYKVLAEAPDPKPLLETSVDCVASATEVAKLTQENSKLNDKLNRYADYETIKAKLMKLEMSSIETTQARVAAKETEMNAIMDEKERTWKLKEEELTRQLRELRVSHEAAESQLSRESKGNLDDEDQSGNQRNRLAELELVANDLERANRQAIQTEKRNLELRKELEELKSGDQEKRMKQEYESRIEDLEGDLFTSTAKLENTRNKLSQIKTESSKKTESMERDSQRKTQEIESLRGQLSKQSDYDEIKRELEIIRSLQFSVNNDDEEDESNDENDGNNTSNKVDKMLYAKNKQLNYDLTTLRVKNGELTVNLEKAQHEVKQLEAELENMRELNNTLEEDIGNMKQGNTGTMSMISGWAPGSWNGGRTSPTTSILGGKEPRGSSISGTNASGMVDNSILPIVTQQRDRFRSRNNELEQELRKNWNLVANLRKELESVKRDNLELYERSRYMTSYKQNNPMNTTSTNVEERYKSLYEDSISPFAIFKGKESQRALNKLNPVDRIAYIFTKSIMTDTISRNIFIIYTVALHIVVIVMLIRTPTSD